MLNKVLFIMSVTCNFYASSNLAYFQNDRFLDIIKSGAKIQTQSTNVASLSRFANLGDFYDRRTETFTGYSIFSSNLAKEAIHSVDNHHANVDYIRTESVSEKMTKLKIDARLAVSALWDVIKVYEGSAHYLKEDKQTFQSAKISLLYSIRTKSEILRIFSNTSKLAMDLDLLNRADATHIVVGIDWGADIVMSVEETNTDSSSKLQVEGAMGKILEDVAQKIKDATDTNFDAENLERSSTFSIQFNSDVTPDVLPQTFTDSIKFIRNVPDLIAKVNDGKGKKMNYILIPIDTVRKVMKRESNSLIIREYQAIDEDILKKAIDLYQDMKNSKLLIKDVYSEIEKWKYLAFDDYSHISAFRLQFESVYYDAQKNIRESIVRDRMVKNSHRSLNRVISSYANSNWTSDNVMQKLASYNKTLDKIKTLKLMQSGKFIGDNFEQILTENYMREIRVISVDLDSLNVSSAIFDRIMGLLKGVGDEGIPYYFKNIPDQQLILITSYKYGNPIRIFDFSINKHEYLLIKDANGFVSIIEAGTNDLVNSYLLPDIAESIIAVEHNRTFYKIDVLSGKIFSASIEGILDHANITWRFQGSFPAEKDTIQSNTVINGTKIMFATKSGILYKFDSTLKTTTVLGITSTNGNYASLIRYKDSIFIQKGIGFYEFNGTDVLTISTSISGKRNNCGLVVIENQICRIGGNMTNRYPDPITCYNPASKVWSIYGDMNQARHSPAIAHTKLGKIVIGGKVVYLDNTEGHWLTSLESFDQSFKVLKYLSGSFPHGLTAPQAVTFNY